MRPEKKGTRELRRNITQTPLLMMLFVVAVPGLYSHLSENDPGSGLFQVFCVGRVHSGLWHYEEIDEVTTIQEAQTMLHFRCLLLHHVTTIRVWKDIKLNSPYQLKVKTLSQQAACKLCSDCCH